MLKDKEKHAFLFTSVIPLYNKVGLFSDNWLDTLNSFYRRKGTERFLSGQGKHPKLSRKCLYMMTFLL
ncbi:hypothetical protein HMPREF0658_0190 [Hoylesella marshii DSM 16973 = JCM 13450]|uniref:Uncharacterized protein n=1 Tax=Hoylesella marshii DSM 16973 = JCM 13450 TaxID=862515 RepID=E0NPT9_9BACT|nr:hypothetical protein HMPREF0658_0190 [Hoylesella marshii DSM 16973 = JCM 13450]